MFQQLLNAAMLRFDGVDGQNAPTKQQVALVWGGIAFLTARVV